jgi:hypothetical protein
VSTAAAFGKKNPECERAPTRGNCLPAAPRKEGDRAGGREGEVSFDYKPREALIASESVPPFLLPASERHERRVCRYNYKISNSPPFFPWEPYTTFPCRFLLVNPTQTHNSRASRATHSRKRFTSHNTHNRRKRKIICANLELDDREPVYSRETRRPVPEIGRQPLSMGPL